MPPQKDRNGVHRISSCKGRCEEGQAALSHNSRRALRKPVPTYSIPDVGHYDFENLRLGSGFRFKKTWRGPVNSLQR